PISITCPACAKKLKAKDSLAGKTVACPGCGQKLVIPQPEEAAASFLLEEETTPEAPPPPPSPVQRRYEEPTSEAPRSLAKPSKKALDSLPPLGANEPPLWLRHLHWLLILALVPLAFSLLEERQDDFFKRLEE